MEIQLASIKDFGVIRNFDSHIPSVRLSDCINNQFVYVLREDSTIVGVLRYSLFWQTIPFLDLIYLDEAYRGKGYGRQMMDYWEGQMLQFSYKHTMLSTQEDETAKYFFEKLGYRKIGAFLPPEQDAEEIMYSRQICAKERS